MTVTPIVGESGASTYLPPVSLRSGDSRGRYGEALCRLTNLSDVPLFLTIETALADDREFRYPGAGGGFGSAAMVGDVPVSGFVAALPATCSLDPGSTVYARVAGPWAYARVVATPESLPVAGGIEHQWAFGHRSD